MSAYPRFFWIAGVVLLFGTVLGAGFVFNAGGDAKYSSGSKTPATDAAPLPPLVMAIGFADGDPGVIGLFPAQSGRVVEVREEGYVATQKGDWLLKLDNRLAHFRVLEAKADRDAAKAVHDQAERLPEKHQIEIKQQKAAIDAVRFQKAAKEQELTKILQLFKDKQISDYDKAAAQDAVESLKATVVVQEMNLSKLELVDPKVDLRRAKADLDAKEARLEQAEYALQECDLVAPEPGTVLRVFVHAGEILGPNPKVPALQFVNNGRKIIRAEVQQEWASLISEGDAADIEDDTTVSSKWSGRVKHISKWLTHRRTPIIEPFMFNDVRTLECIVEITDQKAPLRIGQRVRVTIRPKS